MAGGVETRTKLSEALDRLDAETNILTSTAEVLGERLKPVRCPIPEQSPTLAGKPSPGSSGVVQIVNRCSDRLHVLNMALELVLRELEV